MRRHGFDLLALGSLVICLTAMAVWVLPAGHGAGRWHFTYDTHEHTPLVTQNNLILDVSPNMKFYFWNRETMYWTYRVAVLPCWAVVVVSAFAPAAWVDRRIRRKKIRGLICEGCGYDLRATPGRCPECGMVVEADCV